MPHRNIRVAPCNAEPAGMTEEKTRKALATLMGGDYFT